MASAESSDIVGQDVTMLDEDDQLMLESPPSNKFPLAALPEDILRPIFNYHGTRDMVATGLVSQQFRRLVKWTKHYLTLDCSSRRSEDFTINGSRIPVEKWPDLVEILLDKAIIVSFSVKAPVTGSKTFEILHDVRGRCISRPDQFQLESVAILNRYAEFFFNPVKDKDLCHNLRLLNISGTCLSSGGNAEESVQLIDVVKELPLESIELNLRKNKKLKAHSQRRYVDIAQICAQIQPHKLRVLKTDSSGHSLLVFARNVPNDNISHLKTLSFVGHLAIVDHTEVKETMELLWQSAPYLKFCKFAVKYSKSQACQLQEIGDLIQNIFECILCHSKTTESQPINIVLCAKFVSPHCPNLINLFPCRKDKILAILQESGSETEIFEDAGIEENIFDNEFVGTYTIKRGRISITTERTKCGGYHRCRVCRTDYRLVLRMVFERLDSARRQCNVSKKLTGWQLNRCNADRLIGDLRKKFVNVRLELMPRKRQANSKAEVGQYFSISFDDNVVMIESSLCGNGGCDVC